MSLGKDSKDNHGSIAAGRRVALRAGNQEPIALYSDLLLAYFKTKKNLSLERPRLSRDKQFIGNHHINHKLVAILEKEIKILKENRALTEDEYEYLNSMMINNRISYQVGENEDEILGTPMQLTIIKKETVREDDPPLISPDSPRDYPKPTRMTLELNKNRENYI